MDHNSSAQRTQHRHREERQRVAQHCLQHREEQQRVAQHCLQQSLTSRYGIDIVNNKLDQNIWIQHCHLQHRDE